MIPVRENNMWYTYILQSRKDKNWYTGCTSDLKKRFRQHSENLVLSTKNRGSFNLIYYEACLNKKDAFAREKYLKSGMGIKIFKESSKTLSLTG